MQLFGVIIQQLLANSFNIFLFTTIFKGCSAFLLIAVKYHFIIGDLICFDIKFSIEYSFKCKSTLEIVFSTATYCKFLANINSLCLLAICRNLVKQLSPLA